MSEINVESVKSGQKPASFVGVLKGFGGFHMVTIFHVFTVSGLILRMSACNFVQERKR